MPTTKIWFEKGRKVQLEDRTDLPYLKKKKHKITMDGERL